MFYKVNFIIIASWLGILTMTIQYYIGNIYMPNKREELEEEYDSVKAKKLYKNIKKRCDYFIFSFLTLSVLIGIFGIIIDILK